MAGESEQREASIMMNDPAQMASMVQIRLDTTQLLRNVEMFLSGKRVFLMKDKDGNLFEEEKAMGKPLANQNGITAILNMVNLTANQHGVQGNITREQYEGIVYYARIDLTSVIITNCYEWEIEDSKLNMIIDWLMIFFELFLSRPINNLERDSYAKTFMSKELHMQDKPKSGIADSVRGFIGK